MKLKSWTLALTLVLTTVARAATNDLTGLLQKGLFEEEANRDLTAAIANYQSLANAFDKDRQLAATAIFRLGECYRKLGRTNEAVIQYQRIVKEFADQQTLAMLSRQNLNGLRQGSSVASSSQSSTDDLASLEKPESTAASLQAQVDGITKMPHDQARIFVQQNYPNPILTTLMQELDLAQQSLIKLKLDYTPDHPKYQNAREAVEDLNAKIDSQVEGVIQSLRGKLAVAQVQLGLQRKRQNEMAETTGSGASESATTDEEQTQIRNIQAMIQNSPDLINAPNGDGMTPLLLAAEKGQLVVAKYLLDHGADVNGLSRNHGSVPLTTAAGNGHKAMVELLLARGADVTGRGLNPLYEAVQKGYLSVAEGLLANKADVNLRSGTDTSGARPIHRAVMGDNVELLQLLLNHGADVNVTDAQGRTPLEFAAMENQTNIAKILLAAKAATDAGDKNGDTPLHQAADKGYAETVSLLLNSGAAVDPTNNNNATPLLLAVANGRVDATRLLLDHKADPNHRGLIRQWRQNQSLNPSDRNGQPVSFAIRMLNKEVLKLLLDAGANPEGDSVDVHESSPLFLAIDYNATDSVQLLLEHGADPNRVENGYPALIKALQNGRDKRIIALLLDKGANPNARASDGWPPLLRTQDAEIAQMLIAHKADVNASVGGGFTALMQAAYRATNCLPVLLENGAKIDLQETNGNTALHWAASSSSLVAVAILLEHKANPNIQNKVGNTPLDLAKAGFGGSIPYSLISPEANIAPNTVSAETEHKIAELLVQAGGLANLPKRDRIEVRRASSTPLTIFKDTPGRNQVSLLELIADRYGLLSRESSGEWQIVRQNWWALFDDALRFPDFKKVIIYRRTESSAKQIAINVDIEDILNSGDCSRDVWLQWGDVVEIPEADHPVGEQWLGLSETNANAFIKCLARQVTIKIKGENTTLTLAPKLVQTHNMTSPTDYLWNLTRASFVLRSVLDNSKMIRVSSDLSRVKVSRTDPATKKTTEWIVDCTDTNQPGLWLRDGDVIEVPEK